MILLSYMNWAMGRFDAAVRFATRSLAISRAVLGDDSPDVAFNLTALAVVLSAQGRLDQAIEEVRAATAIHRRRKAAGRGLLTIGLEAEQKSVRFVYLWHAAIAHRLMAADPSQRDRLLNESFEVVQLARATGTSKALASMAARFAVGDDELALLVRERQRLLDSWRRIDKAVIAAAASRSARDGLASDAEQRRQLQAIRRDVAALDARISSDFPEYAEIADPLPLTLGEARALLAGDEALVTFAVAGDPVREMADRSFVHVLRRDRADFYEVAIGGEELAEAVALLRTSLSGDGIATLGELLTRGYESETAVALYRRLLAPAESLLAGVRHVFMVPDGPLQSLPLGVLLTEAPQAPLTDFAGYRQAPWLARRYAMTVLPSVSSLKALRRFARTAQSRKPFMGFGDPVLEGRPGDRRGIRMASVFRGARADVTALRRLPPLPETADELRAIAAVLNAGDDALILGRQATEATVRNTDLSDRRILAFATHGLVAGQIEGQGEPALVLTPPDVASEEDDGLLTASEIARHLKLDADWVILSACNTAAGDAPGAEGLSGLAKAFFYAGARALLVSHWSVQSEAAVGLTTRMLAEAAEHPEIGGAEALKRSMLALMEDPENPHFAHPMFWAPFVLMGEGGSGTVSE